MPAGEGQPSCQCGDCPLALASCCGRRQPMCQTVVLYDCDGEPDERDCADGYGCTTIIDRRREGR